ncbi:MAG: T9SS type A sorting domain-containing protein [Bacteroidetes bacterium]|nr:T9SS type A sorting domain-containing protein [Bacteroidota bacterium]
MKKNTLTSAIGVIFSLISVIGVSQDIRQWGTYYGNTQSDFGYSVANDAAGNTYLAGVTPDNTGYFGSGGFQNVYGGGISDGFLVKFDSNGNRLWSTYYGGSGTDQGYAVAVDVNGDVYLAGYTTSANNIASGFTPYAGASDAFLVKFDSGGNRIWGRYFGSTGAEANTGSTPEIGVGTDGNGNVILTGRTSSGTGIATLGAHQTVYGGGTDAFVVEFDGSGTGQWSTYYGGAGQDVGYGVVTDAADNIYIGGLTASNTNISSPGAWQTVYGGGTDAFLVKFDNNGVRLWGTYYGGGGTDEGRAIAISDTNIFMAGRTMSNTAIASVGAYQTAYSGGGTYDAYLVRFGSAGSRAWGTYYGTQPGDDRGYAVASDEEGNSYLGGRTSSAAGIATADGFQTIYGTGNDAMLIKFGLSGNRICGTYLGGTGSDQAMGLSYKAGRIHMAGYTNSVAGIAGSGFQNTYGGSNPNNDGFLAKFFSCIETTTLQTNLLCNGVCNGVATVNPTGATLLPYTYLWTGGQTTQTATGLCATSYTVVVSDAYGNTETNSVTITQPTALTTTVGANPATCGNNDGAVGVNVAGGTGAYTYNWAPGGATTQVVTGIAAGVYTVTVSDANACTIVATATVTSTGPSVAISSSTNVSCFGGNNGSAAATITGGTPAYTYAWSPSGGTTSAATGLIAANYTVLITDGTGCTATATVAITEPTIFTGSVSVTNATCGSSDGSATLNASGGTLPYAYTWNPTGQTTATATGLAAGNYTVTGTDANGCVQAHAAVITTTGGTTVTISSQTNVLCNGGNNGSAAATVTGGTPAYTYAWSPSGGTTSAATGLTAGNYTVTVTDANSCSGTTTVTITEPTAITTTISTTNTACGSNTGTATINVSGGVPSYTYSWTSSPVQTTTTATGLGVGTYTVLITDANGCTQTAAGTVNTINGPTVTISSQTNVSCFGGNNGSATSSATGGTLPYTYGWTTSPFQFTPTATGMTAGTYTAVISDAVGCTGTSVVTITQPAAITATVVTTNTTCGNNNGTATVNASGGVPSYTYSWSTTPVQTTSTATGMPAGGYIVTITDANGCMQTAAGTVNSTSTPTVSVSSQTNVSCNGTCDGTVIPIASGGTSPYTYSPFPLTNLCAGTYTITVADANGCTNTTTVSITQPTAITASTTTTGTACGSNTGTATVNASGGTGSFTYAWVPGGQNTQTATGLAAGTYTVTVTDANGCTQTAIATVSSTNGPNSFISSSTNVTCNGGNDGSATSSATGGTLPYTYNWSPSGGTNASATGLSAGTYSVTIADANGCTSVTTATISEPAALTTSVTTTNGTCGSTTGSACVAVSGGTAPYTYSWSPVPGSTSCVTGLAAGTYTIAVTDASGCTQTATATIIVANAPVVTIASQTNVSCNGGNDGTATSSVSGGTSPYTYSWSTVPAQTTVTATGLSAGNYIVTVTDASGCTSQSSTTIIQPNGMTVSISSSSATCGNNDGSATASVSNGAAPYSYNWSSGQTTATANSLSAGSYTVTITDANGCTKTATAMIVNSNGPTAFISAQTNTSCNGVSDGTATATATGATPPYIYVWNTSPAQTGATATGLSAGQYTVTVSDAVGCLSIAIVAITEPAAMAVTATPLSNASCSSCCDGTASSSASGGTTPYTYSWSTSPIQTTVTATGLCASSVYTVCITDANGCSNCDTVLIPFTPPTGISQYSILNTQFSVYPNPSSGEFTVYGLQSAVELSVYDVLGNKVFCTTVNRKQETINLNAPAGIYFLQIKTPDGTAVKKIIKE